MNIYENLKKLNFSSIYKKAKEDLSIQIETNSEDLVEELVRYLTILGEDAGNYYAPSHEVDMIFHELFEEENSSLRDKVESILGGNLIHDTTIKGKKLANFYTDTLKVYGKKFGKFKNKKVWV